MIAAIGWVYRYTRTPEPWVSVKTLVSMSIFSILLGVVVYFLVTPFTSSNDVTKKTEATEKDLTGEMRNITHITDVLFNVVPGSWIYIFVQYDIL